MAPLTTGDTVLVTGSNGFIASHIVDQLLASGFHVRGSVRSLERSQWTQDLFDSKYGKGRLERVLVPNFTEPGAYHKAMAGVQGVVHCASDLSFSGNPNDVIPHVVASVREIMQAADKESTIKRFVYTSSSTAALSPQPDVELTVTADTWNEESIKAAWGSSPNPWNVYAASKTSGEQETWRYVKESKPHYEVNTVLPNANFGKLFNNSQKQSSTPSWITGLYDAKEVPAQLASIPPQYFVNVADTAKLHVAALIDPNIKDERVFAFSQPYTWNGLLATLRKLRPDVTFPADIADKTQDKSVIKPRARAEEILKKHFGHGFLDLEESVKIQLESY